MLVHRLLRVALDELDPVGYQQGKDRILGALDTARNKIFPPATRTRGMQWGMMEAYKKVTCEIAKTIFRKELEEEAAYLVLHQYGPDIPLEKLKYLLQKTLDRLEGREQLEVEENVA